MTNKSVFSSAWQAICFVALFSWLSLPAFSGELLYSLSTQQSGVATVHFNTSQLVQDSIVDVILPSGQTVSGVVKRTLTGVGGSDNIWPKETSRTIVSFENNAGALELLIVNNTIVGMILHDTVNRKIYQAIIDSNGRGILTEENVNDYQCVDFPIPPDTGIVNIPPSGLIPDLSALQNLESKPGAAKTLYINYWGGTISGTVWNNNYNSGNDITYTPYSHDSDTTTFSSTDRYLMWLGWREAAEDFAAFDINVTTKQAVYDETAIVNRSQMIATTTNYFYTGAGGVAFVGIFNNTSDYLKTAWAWNSGGGSLGMTISHEAGHQIGLDHDGTSTQEYYRGHGVWGPIMGAPFYREYVQWSKGDYPDANRSENDLTIIADILGVVTDDAGDTTATATNLSIPVTDYEGQITPNGLFSDVDVYSFTLSGTAHIEVKPLLGAEGENRAANLAMNVTLQNSSSRVIASMTSSDNSPLEPTTNTLIYDGTLAADTYYILIEAVSPDTNWATGFDEYGNEGEYRLTISGDSSFTCDTVTEIPSTECEALVALYNSTDGDNWVSNTGWKVTNTPCNWYGVSCSGGHVSELDMSSNQLSGTIPPELGQLSNLEFISLFINQLSGTIPPELGQLNSLKYLWLQSNQLSGTIPPELGQLSSLQELELISNQLSGTIPPELGQLSSLQTLVLSSNQLSGTIPPELGNLTNLDWLYLDSNQLCGKIPSELMNLELSGLGLQSNNLINDDTAYDADFIAWLSQMESDWRNQVSPSYCCLLQFSAPDYNVNEGDISATITVTRSGTCQGAVSVDYATSDDTATAGNDYTAISGTLNWADGDTANKTVTINIIDDSQVESDETIIISLDNATGGAELGTPNTAVLTITDNEPPTGFDCTTVTEIPLEECQALVEIYNSTNGDLWKNNTGWNVTNTPCSWHGIQCNGGYITRVYLQYNQLSGVIPPEIENLSHLEVLNIKNNALCGMIPVELMNLTQLWALSLDNNHLTASDSELIDWLNNLSPGWDTTQTSCPISTLQLSSATYSISENGGQATITVTRTGKGDDATSVDYATSDDTATAPDDYTQTSGTLNWADGDAADKTFTINITDDSAQENQETLIVSLGNPTGGAKLGKPDTATITITDNDTKFNCKKVTDIPKKECKVLIALYDSTDGDNWADNSGWKATNTLCEWYGVTCEEGKVTKLALANNGLKGTISKKLNKLKMLQTLLLNDNKLTGKIPKSLMKLKKLNVLDLNDNCLKTKVSKKLKKWLDEINQGWDNSQTACLY
jgi:Leucine-rich repeat (LRR) protein